MMIKEETVVVVVFSVPEHFTKIEVVRREHALLNRGSNLAQIKQDTHVLQLCKSILIETHSQSIVNAI